jgi:hypothetical protein
MPGARVATRTGRGSLLFPATVPRLWRRAASPLVTALVFSTAARRFISPGPYLRIPIVGGPGLVLY